MSRMSYRALVASLALLREIHEAQLPLVLPHHSQLVEAKADQNLYLLPLFPRGHELNEYEIIGKGQ